MRITLTFNEDEQVEARNALNGSKWMLSMWELDQWLRGEAKYNETRSEKEIDLIDEIREKIREQLNENGINFNDF